MGRLNGIVKFLVTLVLLAALAFGGYMAWLASKIVYVDVASPSSGPVAETIDATGVVTARNVSYVVAKANLDIKSVRFREGESVAAGDVIFIATVDYDAVNSQIDGLRAQISGVTARLEQASADLDKLESLYHDGAVSENIYDNALTLKRELAAQLETLKFQIDSLENSKQEESPSAPVSGVITDILAAEGDTVLVGRPLAEITDMGDIYLTAELTLEDGKMIRVGDKVVLDGVAGAEDVKGEVAKILPKVSQVVSQGTPKKRIDAEIFFDAADLELLADAAAGGGSLPATVVIGDEYDIRIIIAETADAFRAPKSAVFLMNQKYYAYVAENGRARLRELNIGLRGADFYEVKSGVGENDKLILSPGSKGLSDGATIRHEEDGGGSTISFVLNYCIFK